MSGQVGLEICLRLLVQFLEISWSQCTSLGAIESRFKSQNEMNALVSFDLCTLSNSELIEKIDKLTDEMFTTQKVPTRHIPARPNDDYDLLVGEFIKRFQNK